MPARPIPYPLLIKTARARPVSFAYVLPKSKDQAMDLASVLVLHKRHKAERMFRNLKKTTGSRRGTYGALQLDPETHVMTFTCQTDPPPRMRRVLRPLLKDYKIRRFRILDPTGSEVIEHDPADHRAERLESAITAWSQAYEHFARDINQLQEAIVTTFAKDANAAFYRETASRLSELQERLNGPRLAEVALQAIQNETSNTHRAKALADHYLKTIDNDHVLSALQDNPFVTVRAPAPLIQALQEILAALIAPPHEPEVG
ncbi:MAG: hypothetical protein AAF442_01385 [Pseudomonadota bacterium]